MRCVSDQGNLLGGEFRSPFDRRQQATIPEAALLSVLVVIKASAGLVVNEVAIAAFAELLEVAAGLGNTDNAIPFKGSAVQQDAIALLAVEVADHIRLTPTTAAFSFVKQEVVGAGTSRQAITTASSGNQIIITCAIDKFTSTNTLAAMTSSRGTSARPTQTYP